MNRTTELSSFLDSLPPHLAERAWLRSNGSNAGAGEYILYWTHHALRADENPALDTAIHLAEQFQLPLLVYQGLSERYRFASDRHHTFILEAARDLQQQYADLGITYLLHLDREGNRQPRLAQLAKRCAVLVTDDFPIEATKQWTERLAEANWCPLLLVDTACVVPTRKVGRAYDRAFVFRDVTAKLFRERLDRPWPTCSAKAVPAQPPFESLDLAQASIPTLIAQCDIDHSIGPVADTRGGSEEGYAVGNSFAGMGFAATPSVAIKSKSTVSAACQPICTTVWSHHFELRGKLPRTVPTSTWMNC